MSQGNGNGKFLDDDLTPAEPPPIPEHAELCRKMVLACNRMDACNLVWSRMQRELRMARKPVPGETLLELADGMQPAVTGMQDVLDEMRVQGRRRG